MRDIKELERIFDKASHDWDNKIIPKHAKIMGLKIVKECKKLTPVDTGNLRRRWFYKIDRKKGELVLWISNDAEYAAHVNYGHRIVRGGKTAGKIKGKHMLEKGMEYYQDNYMKKDIENMLEELRSSMK